MGDLELKQQKLDDELEIRNLKDAFSVREGNNGDKKTLLYQLEQKMGNGSCLMTITMDDNCINEIYYSLGVLSNVSKKEQMLQLLNNLNEESVALEFYLSTDYNIFARTLYLAKGEGFDAELLIYSLIGSYKYIQESCYPKIMRVMWS